MKVVAKGIAQSRLNWLGGAGVVLGVLELLLREPLLERWWPLITLVTGVLTIALRTFGTLVPIASDRFFRSKVVTLPPEFTAPVPPNGEGR